jgi:hypothetical protein
MPFLSLRLSIGRWPVIFIHPLHDNFQARLNQNLFAELSSSMRGSVRF